MAIDILSEAVVSPTEAARLLPRRRAGKKPNVATLYRWMTTGCRGVLLESIQVGGTRSTSREALQRFCERLTNPSSPPSPVATSYAQRRAVKAAEKVLDAAGI